MPPSEFSLKYKIREGTINLGKEYEINVLTLLSLQCLSWSEEDFWFASNADGVGAFDDIILHLGQQTFMLQLKQTTKEIPKVITEQQLFASQKKEFYLKKYISDMCNLQKDLNCTKVNRDNADIIPEIGSFDNIYFLLYTNRDVEPIDFLIQHNDNDVLSYLNSTKNSKLFRIDVEKVSSKLGLNGVKDINNFYMFCNQIDARDVPSRIEEEIRKLTKSGYSKTVCEDFIKFIIEWSKGNLGGHFCLTKRDIVSKLTELLFSNYEVKLLEEPYRFYESEEKLVWNKIIKSTNITVIDTNGDDIIFNFLLEYIGSEVKECCKITKKKNWFDNLSNKDRKLFYKKNPNLKWQIFKTAGSSNNIVLYHVYKCLWKCQKLPLVLEVSKKEQYRQICDILKLSNYSYKVIILNKSGECLTLDRKVNHFENLHDLNDEDKEEILMRQLVFQGRSSATLKDLLDENMFAKIKSSDIINILLGTYSVGKQLNNVPKYYIPRMFKNALSYDVLKYVTSDIFFIEDPAEFIKDFAVKENLEILMLDNSHFKNIDDLHIVVSNKEGIQEQIQYNLERLKYFGENVHHLVANTSYLICKKSYGSTEKIEKYMFSEENFPFPLTTVISADPGMGKSTLMDSIAKQLPTNKWVIKIDLKQHGEYYEMNRNKLKQMKSIDHLSYFQSFPNSNKLEKVIFKKLVRERNIVILMDGFDEISMPYKDKVTTIASSFYQDKFSIYLSTRRMERSHLEETFKISALELLPFNPDCQKQFLKKYFIENEQSLVNYEAELDEFIEKLLRAFVENISSKIRVSKTTECDFTAAPLHIMMLGDVFISDCKSYILHKAKIDFDQKFDLVDLYEKFINMKHLILCRKFGSTGSYIRFKEYQSLVALKLLFSNFIRTITVCINKLEVAESDAIRSIQKGGTIVVDENNKVNFTHQTYAEYFAAEWIFNNLDSNNEETRNIVRSVYTICTMSQLYPFLLKVLDHLLVTKGVQVNDLFKDMYLSVINGQADKALEIINSNQITLNATDEARRSILHLVVIYYRPYRSLKPVLLEIAKKLLEVDADIFGYTPIDYAIGNGLYELADLMCEKWANLKISYCSLSRNEFIGEMKQYSHLMGPLLAYYAYADVMLKRVKKLETVRSYLCDHIITDSDIVNQISFRIDTHKSISELENFQVYIRSNLCYEVTFGSTRSVEKLLKTNDKVDMRDSIGNAPLHYAAFYGKKEIMDLLLSKHPNVNIRGTHGETPLHCSILGNKLQIFDKLLKTANVNAENIFGNTPLHYAVMFKRLKIIKLLLREGADIKIENWLRLTPLHLVAQVNKTQLSVFTPEYTEDESEDIISLLADRVDINISNSKGYTPLHYSVECGNREIVDKLILHEADVNTENIIDKDTPLHSAIRSYFSYHADKKNYLNIISTLLSKNAKLDTKNVNGDTPLHLATKYGDYNVVSKLISYKPDVNAQNNAGNTPLHQIILESENQDLIGLLWSNIANFNIKNKDGDTPLHLGVITDNCELVRELLRYDVDVNVQNNKGNTPLHQAMEYHQNVGLTGLLVSNGAKSDLKNNDGDTPLHLGVITGNYELVSELLRYDVDVNVQNNAGDTPLHCVVAYAHGLDLVGLLVSNGANLDLKNNDGDTPFDFAVKIGWNGMIHELIRYKVAVTYRTIQEILHCIRK